MQRGIGIEQAISLLISFVKMCSQCSMEFASEDKLLALKLEGTVG
jgi:hypothetical protein